MLYTDTLFLFIFALLCLVTRLLRPFPVIKEWLLIAVSFFLIATWGFFDLGLFLVVLAINYVAAKSMVRAGPRPARLILTSLISFDVATLVVFKYANFIGHNVGALSGIKLPAFPLGIPLAISFYTFHLISYLVDLHAGKIKIATKREYIFYLSFFPHVIAGPIVRAWQLVPQIGKIRRVRTDLFMGLHFLVTGFFLKMVMANNIGRAIDPFWNDPTNLSVIDHWVTALLYYCQIYGDFAGYSLMALGMARLLGYRLPVNFRGPMSASTIQEFWQRWHITLSKWLRDYLYIPLGGGRVPPLQSARNVMITMLLGGLWHGAAWGFLIWGGLHGVGIVAERFLGMRGDRPHRFGRLWGVATQLWVIIAWVFFRAPNVHSAFAFLGHMIPSGHLMNTRSHEAVFLRCFIFAIPVIAHNFVPAFLRWAGRRYLGLILGLSTGVLLVLNVLTFSPEAVFIYFKF